jgi:hypothetical protein
VGKPAHQRSTHEPDEASRNSLAAGPSPRSATATVTCKSLSGLAPDQARVSVLVSTATRLRGSIITSNLAATFVRPCHLADPSLLHQSTIAARSSLLINSAAVVCDDNRMVLSAAEQERKVFRKSSALGELRLSAKGGDSYDTHKQNLFGHFHHLGFGGTVTSPELCRSLAVISERAKTA